MSNKESGIPTAEDVANEPKNYGKRGYLTAEQEISAKEFMEQVDKEALKLAQYSVEDPRDTVCRYLRSRKFDVKEALKLMMQQKEMKIIGRAKEYAKMTPDTAGDCDVQVLKTFYPHTMAGYDKENRPILWEMTGQINTSAVMAMMTKDLLLGYHYWTMETKLGNKFIECSKLPPFARSSLSAKDAPTIPKL